MLGKLGVDEFDIDAMRAGAEPADPVHAAVYAFARDVVRAAGKVDDDVVQRAHDVGLTDADLLQLVAECVFAGLVGIVDNLAGRVPLDEFLSPGNGNRADTNPSPRPRLGHQLRRASVNTSGSGNADMGGLQSRAEAVVLVRRYVRTAAVGHCTRTALRRVCVRQ